MLKNQLAPGNWPLSQHPLPPARHQPHLLIPSTQDNIPGKNEEFRDEIQLPTNLIILPWSTYTEPRVKRTQKPELTVSQYCVLEYC